MEPNETRRFIQFLHTVKRSRSERRLGGVCGGFGTHSDLPAWVYRVIFFMLLFTGLGFILYIALWICMPIEEASVQEETTAAPSVDPPLTHYP